KNQMPFMAKGGDCPSALSRALGCGVHRSGAKTLEGRSGRIRRRVCAGRAWTRATGISHGVDRQIVLVEKGAKRIRNVLPRRAKQISDVNPSRRTTSPPNKRIPHG